VEEGMEEQEVNLETVLSIWWAWAWRFLIFSMLGGAVFGGIGGFIVGATGHPEMGGSVGALMGFIVGIPISIWTLKTALRIKYRGCSLALVRRSQS